MNVEEVLALAASHGIRMTLELGDLHLEADHEPPAEALVALRDHKEAIVAEVGRVAATAGEWCRIFEDRVATVMRARSLPRPETERAAYEIVLVEFLNRTYPDTPSDRCAGAAAPRGPPTSCCRSGWAPHGCTTIAGPRGARAGGQTWSPCSRGGNYRGPPKRKAVELPKGCPDIPKCTMPI